MVEILGQTTPKSATQIGSKLPMLCFTRHIHGFYCESSLQYGDGKNSKAYQNSWSSLKSSLERGFQLLYI